MLVPFLWAGTRRARPHLTAMLLVALSTLTSWIFGILCSISCSSVRGKRIKVGLKTACNKLGSYRLFTQRFSARHTIAYQPGP